MIRDQGASESRRRWIGPRGYKVVHTGAWSLIAKCCAACNLFVPIPFVLHALGPERFGAWATLVSLVAFAGFLDFGLGNGTMNMIAAAHGRDANAELRAVLREGRRALLQVAALILVLAIPAALLLNWNALLGLPSAMSGEARGAAAVLLLSVVIAIPLNLSNRVQLGLGKGHLTFRWQAIGQLLAMGCTVGLALAGASLPALTMAAITVPLFGPLANSFQLSRDALIKGKPVPAKDSAMTRRIRNEGLLFFLLQLAAAFAFTADLPLISILRGATEAGAYSIVQRLFSIVPLMFSLAWTSLWPIYRQALATKDHHWILRTFRSSLIGAFVLSSIAATILLLGFHIVVSMWIRHPLQVPTVLVAGFAVWSVLESVGTAIATFFNAASIMRFQVIVASIFAVVCVATKVWVLIHVGVDFLPWATVATYALLSLLPLLVFGRRLMTSAFAKDY